MEKILVSENNEFLAYLPADIFLYWKPIAKFLSLAKVNLWAKPARAGWRLGTARGKCVVLLDGRSFLELVPVG